MLDKLLKIPTWARVSVIITILWYLFFIDENFWWGYGGWLYEDLVYRNFFLLMASPIIYWGIIWIFFEKIKDIPTWVKASIVITILWCLFVILRIWQTLYGVEWEFFNPGVYYFAWIFLLAPLVIYWGFVWIFFEKIKDIPTWVKASIGITILWCLFVWCLFVIYGDGEWMFFNPGEYYFAWIFLLAPLVIYWGFVWIFFRKIKDLCERFKKNHGVFLVVGGICAALICIVFVLSLSPQRPILLPVNTIMMFTEEKLALARERWQERERGIEEGENILALQRPILIPMPAPEKKRLDLSDPEVLRKEREKWAQREDAKKSPWVDQNIRNTMQVSPEEQKTFNNLSKKLGTVVIRDNLQRMMAEERVQRINELTEGFGVTRKALEDPTFANLASDDVEELCRIEDSVNKYIQEKHADLQLSRSRKYQREKSQENQLWLSAVMPVLSKEQRRELSRIQTTERGILGRTASILATSFPGLAGQFFEGVGYKAGSIDEQTLDDLRREWIDRNIRNTMQISPEEAEKKKREEENVIGRKHLPHKP